MYPSSHSRPLSKCTCHHTYLLSYYILLKLQLKFVNLILNINNLMYSLLHSIPNICTQFVPLANFFLVFQSIYVIQGTFYFFQYFSKLKFVCQYTILVKKLCKKFLTYRKSSGLATRRIIEELNWENLI